MDFEHWTFSLREAKTKGHVQNGKRLLASEKRLAILPWLRSFIDSGGPMPPCRLLDGAGARSARCAMHQPSLEHFREPETCGGATLSPPPAGGGFQAWS
ncbi:MAG: hypothetical protein WDN29_05365 [Methylovirgula sp.]